MLSVRFSAADGCALGGFLHAPNDRAARHAVVLATGAGIRAEAYRHFLGYLASHGIAALAFDYRGIGESRPRRMRGFDASFEDWAEHDTAGAIAWMAQRYADVPLTGIGHSIGALLIGASEAAQRLAQLVLIAPHTGRHADYPPSTRWLVRLVWGAAGAPLRALFGYFPAHALRLGEDLPASIASGWAAAEGTDWRAADGSVEATRQRTLLDRIAGLRKPALALSFADDAWATEDGVRRALHAYRNLLVVRRPVAPAELGRRKIGHWGFFRRSAAATLWPIVLRFIDPAAVTHANAPSTHAR